MLPSTQNRVELILQTIDRLGIVKIKHLQDIHDLKSYRNACKIITQQLRPYIHERYFHREKVMYLNKKGKELIASEKDEVKVNDQTIHSLLRNEVYIYFQCPIDWQNEYALQSESKAKNNLPFFSSNLPISNKKRIVCDAAFKRNGYLHIIEVDNTQDMRVNKRKIETYREVLPAYKEQVPFLYFFTKTEARKRKLEEWLKGIRYKVMTFDEIR